MSETTELIAQQILNGNINKRTWGDIIYNVKVYGAKGDEVKDDLNAIQSAINAASTAGGGTVVFPPGTYISSGGISLKSNVNLVGIKNASIIKLRNASTSPLIQSTSASNFLISDLILDGNKVGQTFGSGLDVIKLTSCSNVKVLSCEIKNGYFGHGVELVGCSKVEINENYIHDNGGNGVLYSNSQEVEILNNRVEFNQQRGIGDTGTTVNGSSYITIEDNTVANNTLEGIGFKFADDVALTPHTIYAGINRNLVRQNLQHGIVVKANYSTVSGNQVIENGSASDTQGIVVQATDCLISDNLVNKNKGVGIDLGNCLRCIVSNNHVTYNGCLGIELNSTEDTTVVGNVVMYNNNINYSFTTTAGIMVQNTVGVYPGWTGISQNVTIDGNRVVTGSFQMYGVYVDSTSKYVIVTDNILKTSGNNGDLYSTSAFFRDIGNITGSSQPDVISATAAYDFVITATQDYFKITGTTTMNTIKLDSNVLPFGKRIVLQFTTVMVVNNKATSSGNIFLTGSVNLTTTVGTVLELICDGTQWVEITRSVK